jgi:AcrR family transcriptional regulator
MMKKKAPRTTKTTVPAGLRRSLRQEHAARTTERLLKAAARFLETHPGSELTLPQVARLAGVTPPTAYTNFGTVEQLYRMLYDSLQPRLGTRDPIVPPDRLHEVPLERFPRFEAQGGLLRAIWSSASWSRYRSSSRRPYLDQARANLKDLAPEADEETLLMAMGAIMAFSYPPMWHWLRDVIGMDEEQAAAAAAWATRALVETLRQGDVPVKVRPAAGRKKR